MERWAKLPAAKENLRLYEAPDTWRRYTDEVDRGTNTVTAPGCAAALDRVFTSALNATNVLLLTGAGSSFCARNPAPSGGEAKKAPGLADLWNAVKAKAGDAKFNAVLGIIPYGDKIENIEKLLTQCKLYVALFGEEAGGKGDQVAEFIRLAEAAILERVDFIDGKTDLTAHEALIRKIARRGNRKPRAKIFTTNYDLCFEYAAQRQRFVVIDGFSHAAPQVYDRSHFAQDIVRRDTTKDVPDYLESVFQLYKLHGSMDWRRVGIDTIRSRGADGTPVLIYPRDSKYQEAFEPPYLDMMAALLSALREPDTALIVAGFSFSDAHISEPITAALESNMNFRLVVCDPAFLPDEAVKGDPVMAASKDAPANAFHQKLARLAQTGDQRLSLIYGRFEDLALALPDLVAETERERHAARVKALREIEPPGGEAKSA